MVPAKFAWELCRGGVTKPRGYLAAGVAAQVRKKGRRDLALVYSEEEALACALYTTNLVKAAPLLITRENLSASGGKARAVVANSGIANACTGAQGLADARRMAEVTAEVLGIPASHVIVASTGVIGVPLPMDAIVRGIQAAARALSREGGEAAAEAIMTTDTCPKESAARLFLGAAEVFIGAMAKGSGMIHPDLATMLAFFTTDAALTPAALASSLRWAVERTFNAVTVDGDTSTNDMVVLLANGRAGNPPVEEDTPEYYTFREALAAVAEELAKMIARDGEGATKLLEVRVLGARREEEARRLARAVARSNLVKAALFGEDANWGRILTAAGSAGVIFDPGKVDVYLGDTLVAAAGCAVPFDEEEVRTYLAAPEVVVTLHLHEGEAAGKAWGCDLSYDYVRINAHYRT